MPCYYTGSAEGDLQLTLSETREALREVTEHLCNACRYIENRKDIYFNSIDPTLDKWWAEHRKLDEQRERKQRAKKELDKAKKIALSKLTSDDKRILGINSP